MFNVFTHAQQFHIDEVVAIALLDLYYLNGDYILIRTNRNDIRIEEAKLINTSFVIDVGFDYNPYLSNFDHHQNSDNLCWNDGVPYSSCGLVWQWLKNTNKLSQIMNNETIIAIEEAIIKKVDKHDNGIELWNEGRFISLYNRKPDNPSIQDVQFKKAVESTKDYIENILVDIRANIKAEKTILKYIENSIHIDDVVIFGSNVQNGPSRVSALTDKQLVIIPRTKHSWTIQSVPKNIDDIFSLKCPSPLNWRGLNGDELSTISGIPNMLFCHKNGYLTMLVGTIEDAILVARIIIEKNKSS